MDISITKQEYKQFYIYNYYYGSTWSVRYMRMYVGPLMFMFGAYMMYAHPEINPYISAILVAYGLFYTIKPVLMSAIQRKSDETFSFKVKNYNLHIKDRNKEGNIDLKTNKLKENNRYFFVKLKNGQSIFFPKSKITAETQLLFRENMIK